LLLVAVQPESGVIAYLVAHHLRPGQDTLLAEEYITNIMADRVMVSIPETTLQKMPAYRSDADLQQEVERVLFDLTSLHVDYKGMTIRVLDGVLYLDGNISSSLRADVVQDQASGVQGLLGIKNNLIGDDTLAADLASALGRDERTHDLPIGVYPKLGVVRLGGAVHTPQQRAAAEEIARTFPNVRGVANTLVVNANADFIHVMSPAEGGEANDIVPGKYIRHTK
jgi:osmotically-inducible protein OsmY